MGLAVDALFFIAAFATPVAVCIGMLAEGKGSVATKLSTSFTWHPILMTLAFSCFMVLGRWAYVTDSLGDKVKQRPVHRAFMALGALFALGGYAAIFVAHVQKPTFFGYNFHTRSWAVPTRVLHDLFGYGVLLLTLTQASMGLQKLAKLSGCEDLYLSWYPREGHHAPGICTNCHCLYHLALGYSFEDPHRGSSSWCSSFWGFLPECLQRSCSVVVTSIA